jgi:hypothetical protein
MINRCFPSFPSKKKMLHFFWCPIMKTNSTLERVFPCKILDVRVMTAPVRNLWRHPSVAEVEVPNYTRNLKYGTTGWHTGRKYLLSVHSPSTHMGTTASDKFMPLFILV